ncbi:SRPBCC family protein [Knoellia subterranea]|uniref:Polyketide cyclase n=1 Tax=Knoellia subterranea KCTC 19937 TaxID=1385521 RepID=A0A0A0JLH3_9MICO|nr:SRPBCC family protein [Knoellia subterranea]KGN37594.1 hypothetical protein N803_14065 [Knoellia subterranea KCTC 19937]
MGVVEFELARVVHAPVADVFARLADIDGYDAWMPKRGSIRRHSEQTTSGPPRLGTTYLDRTLAGPTPGEISEFEPPTRLVFHWWTTQGGKVVAEGWPAYRLEAKGDHTTLVHHHARLETRGIYRPVTPLLRWMAVRERTTTVEALQASFGHQPDN